MFDSVSSWSALVAGLVVGVTACGVSTPWVGAPRPVAGLPDHFVVDTTAQAALPSSATTPACVVHLIDLQSVTRLRLVHSARQGERASGPLVGDYAVEPPRRYGLMTGEGLRINCETGQTMGAVPLISH